MRKHPAPDQRYSGKDAPMPKPIRPIRIEGNIAYVPLTQGYEAVIDAADVPLVSGFNWYARVDGGTVYAVRNGHIGLKKRTIFIHRVIMGKPKGFQIDHMDRNGLNNMRCNLRRATVPENQYNATTRSDNSSGFKGVYLCKKAKKWRAQIKFNGKNKHLGSFDAPKDAHKAYAKASAELHGEFGRTE